jgi:hypothetical protein
MDDFFTNLLIAIFSLIVAAVYFSLLIYIFGIKWAIIITIAIKLFERLYKRE